MGWKKINRTGERGLKNSLNQTNNSSNHPSQIRKSWKRRKKTRIWAITFTLLLFIPACFLQNQVFSSSTPEALSQPSKPPTQVAQNPIRVGVSVPEIAKQVTVRIITNPGAGSGVIVGHRGQTYKVLTCDHVVANRSDNRYTVLTTDGRTHAAQWLRSVKFGDTDLALVEFNSNQSYQIAEIGEANKLSIGDEVYAAGFPNWYWANSNAIEDTRDWGLRAYRLTTGQVGMIAERSLPRGYRLGYTNEVEQGMSGGPVLDRFGRLVAINGRLKFPPQGIEVYTFADGTVPSPKLFQQMEALSWAIPIDNFRQRVGQQ